MYIDASNPHWTCTAVLGSLCRVNRRIQSSTRSAVGDTADYIKRRTRTKFGSLLSHDGPAAWNSLPGHVVSRAP